MFKDDIQGYTVVKTRSL